MSSASHSAGSSGWLAPKTGAGPTFQWAGKVDAICRSRSNRAKRPRAGCILRSRGGLSHEPPLSSHNFSVLYCQTQDRQGCLCLRNPLSLHTTSLSYIARHKTDRGVSLSQEPPLSSHNFSVLYCQTQDRQGVSVSGTPSLFTQLLCLILPDTRQTGCLSHEPPLSSHNFSVLYCQTQDRQGCLCLRSPLSTQLLCLILPDTRQTGCLSVSGTPSLFTQLLCLILPDTRQTGVSVS